MRVLIACEFSGIVRDAFSKRGWDAWSCDLLETESPGNHYQTDVLDILDDSWDLLISHPPCTYLSRSGAQWWPDREEEQQEALDFVYMLMHSNVSHWALENPIGLISSTIRKPDQIIQPWMFGHGETKATCLWLSNLPKLTPTNIVDGRKPVSYYVPPGPNRWKIRSKTYQGIADAMADQWTDALT